MKYLTAILVLILAGCLHDSTPKTQTMGGGVNVTRTADGELDIDLKQPSNPDESAFITIEGDKVTISTGSSRKDEFAGLGLKLDQYKPFSYVGAAMCVAGVGLFIASFYFPLIPKMAGPIVFVGGAGTAYMATAIPEYGHYALVICVIGFVAWYYHHSAAKKHPDEFQKKPTA